MFQEFWVNLLVFCPKKIVLLIILLGPAQTRVKKQETRNKTV